LLNNHTPISATRGPIKASSAAKHGIGTHIVTHLGTRRVAGCAPHARATAVKAR
jgi:hypothetical protein